MKQKQKPIKVFITTFIIWTFLISSVAMLGQELVASRSIAGSTSIFTFPKAQKSRQKRFTATRKASVNRTTSQRRVTRKNIRRQYSQLAKVTKRRERIKVVAPSAIPIGIPADEGAVVFAGVGKYYLEDANLNVDESLKFYKKATELDESNVDAKLGYSDALIEKADNLTDENSFKEAKVLYVEAINYNPENSVAYSGLGEVEAQLEENEEAIKNYEKALAIDPDLTEVYSPLGILFYKKGEFAKADTNLKKALASEPDNAETQYFLGLVLYTQDDNRAALNAFTKAVELNPDDPEPHFFRGETLERLGNDAEAIAEFEKATQLKPDYVDAWFSLGIAYYNSDQFKKSAEAYEQTLKLQNDFAEAYVNAADAYRQLAEEENNLKEQYKLLGQSASKFELAISFINNNPTIAKGFSVEELDEIYNKYGYVLGQKNILAGKQAFRHDWSKAIEILTKAAETDPSAVDYTNLGWAYFNESRRLMGTDPEGSREVLRKGKASLEKALTLQPNETVLQAIRLNLGITLIDLGDFDGAISNLKPVADERKDWSFANYALGVAYFKKGSFNEAVNIFEQAIKSDPNYIDAYSGLANAYLQRGKDKEVGKIINDLKKLGTRDALAEANRLQTALRLKGFVRN